jgi:hypothetical protein
MEAPDPRAAPFARIPAELCLLVYNSDLAWSAVAAGEYAAARGIPSRNLVGVPLGTSEPWAPGNVLTFQATASYVRQAWLALQARALLLAPGVPTRAACPGVMVGITYNASATGFPPVAHLLAGCPSLDAELGGVTLTCQENGSGRWEWYRRDIVPGLDISRQLWRGTPAWRLGRSDDRNSTDFLTDPLVPLAADPGVGNSVLSEAGTQLVGDSVSRVLPVAKIGWGGWRPASVVTPESPSNWSGPLQSGLLGDALGAQPGPILASLFEVGQSIYRYAALASQMAAWGYSVEYFYRTTSIPAAVEALCPVAGAVWTKTDFEGGSVVDEPYYLLTGSAPNGDGVQTTAPFDEALAPTAGARTASMGASYGFEWALHSFLRGGASGNVDCTHRTSAEMSGTWLRTWATLRAMTGIELSMLSGGLGTDLPAGDPLYRPFAWDPAASVPLAPWTPVPRATPPRYWGARQLRPRS